MTENENSARGENSFAQRFLGAVDLAIDFATLGEYGLEPLPADGPVRERRGRKTTWEALTTARRGGCATAAGRRRSVRVRGAAY
jgi:hypothetical protein